MSVVVYPQQIEFSRFLFEVKSKHFHQYTPLARQDKGKKYFAIDDTHRGLVVQISPNMLSGIIYARDKYNKRSRNLWIGFRLHWSNGWSTWMLHHIFGKYKKTRSHTDGFQRNNAKCLDEKGISRFVPHSSIWGFWPVFGELGKQIATYPLPFRDWK